MIQPLLETVRRRTRPRTVDLYDVFVGCYVLKSGCQWRILPHDFPKWQTCYKCFRQWSEKREQAEGSLLEQTLKKSAGAARQRSGRSAQTGFCIVDSQSVKNTDSSDEKGYDAGKRVSGIKRHIAVDTHELLHALHVTTANVTDHAGAVAMSLVDRAHLSRVKTVLVDGGYTGQSFTAAVQDLLGAAVTVATRQALHTFIVLPQSWVVERSFAWLEKCRRLCKNCERKLNTSLQVMVLAFTALILRRL